MQGCEFVRCVLRLYGEGEAVAYFLSVVTSIGSSEVVYTGFKLGYLIVVLWRKQGVVVCM